MNILHTGKRVIAVAAFISICVIQVPAAAEEGNGLRTAGYCAQCHSGTNQLSAADFLEWERRTGDIPSGWLENTLDRISDIEDSLGQLKRILADTRDQEGRLVSTKQHLRRLVHHESPEDVKYMGQIVDLELRSLEVEGYAQLAHAERLDMLYILLLVVTMSLVFGIAVYVIYMYLKRKK